MLAGPVRTFVCSDHACCVNQGLCLVLWGDEFMADDSAAATNELDIWLALLNWPFLMFVFLIVFIFLFRGRMGQLFARGDIQIGWGENKFIKLKDLSDEIDQDQDLLREELQQLRAIVNELQERCSSEDNGEGADADAADEIDQEAQDEVGAQQPERDLVADRQQLVEERLQKALRNPKFRWRSIDRIAAEAGVDENEALDYLRADDDVVLSVSKNQRQIARLKSR